MTFKDLTILADKYIDYVIDDLELIDTPMTMLGWLNDNGYLKEKELKWEVIPGDKDTPPIEMLTHCQQ